MDDLFSQYEQELGIFRAFCREYAERFPHMASQLQLNGDVCEDPSIERLIQSVALLSAGLSQRIDDNYPQFTEGLLNLQLPHILKPFPSCAIAQFARPGTEEKKSTATMCQPRGALLESAPVQNVRCTFQTAFDVRLAPLALTMARFEEMLRAPAATRLPAGAASEIRIDIAGASAKPLKELLQGALTVYVDGDPALRAALLDTLFRNVQAVYVQAGEGSWCALASSPIGLAGLEDKQALVPSAPGTDSVYRLLTEYFAFPEKFNFFNIDLAALHRHVPDNCTRLSLHLVLSSVQERATLLSALSARNLMLACTPVVNLFKHAAIPMATNRFASNYTVLAHTHNAAGYEIYSIDRVFTVEQVGSTTAKMEFRALGSSVAGTRGQDNFWQLHHNAALAMASPGHEKSITLLDASCQPQEVEKTSLSIDLKCTNRDLPSSLTGDALTIKNKASSADIRLLRTPTRQRKLARRGNSHWQLIALLAPGKLLSAQDGGDRLREILSLCDFARSPLAQRLIAGVIDLRQVQTTAWFKLPHGASLIDGTEVRLTVDEAAFKEAGLYLFAQLVDRLFSLHATVNSFVELVISDKTGKELFRLPPRRGLRMLL